MSRPLILFYLLVLYVLFQFSWWAYLLMDLNQEIFQYRLELLKYTHAGKDITYHEKVLYAEALQKKWAMILGEGLAQVGLGIVAGLALAWATSRLLSGLLFGVTTSTPLPYALVAMLLIVVAVIASLAPARRAMRIEPVVALRGD